MSLIHFGSFVVTSQVFHLTPLTYALVNIKPLLPGHVLVIPRRITPRISDLTHAEVADLFLTVQNVGRMVERVYDASSLNIGIQDGVDAGQSVPHVHVHIIPRKHADLNERGGSDAIYEMLEGEEGNVGRHLLEKSGGARPKFPKVHEEDRKPRTEPEMVQEAQRLAQEMEKA